MSDLFWQALETRECACGCGKTFRVMPGSPQEHASRECAGKKPSRKPPGPKHKKDKR